jgi:hypothetical protein
MNLRHFVVEQKEVGGRTLSQAALTFSESNRGIASWLAAPGTDGCVGIYLAQRERRDGIRREGAGAASR